ncbi:hypothetical protein ACFOKI_07580 [Sphingomonas qilianensis]|uniref:Uncharacterized protein n=1 Tax=Sphingomonas qilianensis TaxID=1736690 RepID=A0ABU9XR01_9SPHN
MDLSFPRFDHAAAATLLPPDLAVMLVAIVARQTASPTALSHARLADEVVTGLRLAPLSGAFNAAVAASLLSETDIKAIFTEPL